MCTSGKFSFYYIKCDSANLFLFCINVHISILKGPDEHALASVVHFQPILKQI